MKFRLAEDDRIWIDGVACEVVRSTRIGHVLRTVGSQREREEILDEDFQEAFETGAIEIERGYFTTASSYGRRGPPVATLLADLTEEEVEETLLRLDYVERYETLRAEGTAVRTTEGYSTAARSIYETRRIETLATFKGKAGRAPRGGRVATERTAPSGTQLRRWSEAWRASGLGGLSPRTGRCGNRTKRFDPVVEEMLERTVRGYCSRNAPSCRKIHERLGRHLRSWNRRHGTDLAIPSYTTICSRVTKLPLVDREVGRRSLGEAQRTLATSRGGLAPRHLLERVEIDEWEVDLVALLVEASVWKTLDEEERRALKPVRCWLSAAICCTSSCVLSLHLSLENPSARTAVAALRQVLVDKTPLARAAGARSDWPFGGSPTTLGVDKGAGFKSVLFRRIAADLRCSNPRPPAGFPHLRGTIERFFGTLDAGLLAFFTGRTFSNLAARGDYDSQAMASITVEELRKAVIRFVCDVYHRRKQAVLGNLSPAQVWAREEARTRVLPPPSPARMRDIFGAQLVRTIEKKGLRFGGTYYHSAWLDELWLRDGAVPVEIRVDPEDLSAISVRAGPATWISVNAVGGRRYSKAEVLAAIKLAAAQPKTGFDDEVENQRVMDEAFADLEELGEAARIAAGVPDPQASPAQIASLKSRHRRLWEAREARRASRGLDHLDGLDPIPSQPHRPAAGRRRKTPSQAQEGPVSIAEPTRPEKPATLGERPVRDPRKPRFEIRS